MVSVIPKRRRVAALQIMKYLFRSLSLITLLAAPFTRGATDNSMLPDRAAVVAIMERAADWQLAHPYTKAPPTDWTNAAFYTGLLALADTSSSPRFHDAMMGIAERNQWKLGPLPYHA